MRKIQNSYLKYGVLQFTFPSLLASELHLEFCLRNISIPINEKNAISVCSAMHCGNGGTQALLIYIIALPECELHYTLYHLVTCQFNLANNTTLTIFVWKRYFSGLLPLCADIFAHFWKLNRPKTGKLSSGIVYFMSYSYIVYRCNTQFKSNSYHFKRNFNLGNRIPREKRYRSRLLLLRANV